MIAKLEADIGAIKLAVLMAAIALAVKFVFNVKLEADIEAIKLAVLMAAIALAIIFVFNVKLEADIEAILWTCYAAAFLAIIFVFSIWSGKYCSSVIFHGLIVALCVFICRWKEAESDRCCQACEEI